MTLPHHLSRRRFLSTCAAGSAVLLGLPRLASASAREIGWEDLIPPGVPYAEVIGEGYMDEETDVWRPVFDKNATRLNPGVTEQTIRLPGYIVPLELDGDAVSQFILAPYAGACIHVPPPPANQMVLVTPRKPWPVDKSLDAIWAIGELHPELSDTGLATVGYRMQNAEIELYEW
nr:DUF3299 domain-containing protein [uncultured Celeribacter sp.]